MTNRNNIEQLFKVHYAQLHRLAIALLHDDDSACDIIHDVFESLLISRSIPPVNSGYLAQAVRNRCLNHLRNCNRHERLVNLYFTESKDYDTEEWPDDATITKIYDIIKSELSDQCRRVMELRFISGLAFTAVAKEMGISENAVYKHVRHALRIIHKNLNKNG